MSDALLLDYAAQKHGGLEGQVSTSKPTNLQVTAVRDAQGPQKYLLFKALNTVAGGQSTRRLHPAQVQVQDLPT